MSKIKNLQSSVADLTERCLIGTDPPSVIIHTAEADQAPYQALSFYLENSLNIPGTCAIWNPSDTAVNSSNGSAAVHLVDCLGCYRETVERRIHRVESLTFAQGKIVLFNVDVFCPMDTLVKLNKIWGIFYQDDSKSIFFEGMRTILMGSKWLPRYRTSSSNFAPNVAYETPEQILRLLTSREKEIIQMVATGMRNKDIGLKLEISVHTVKTHVYNIYKKIGVSNRLQAALWAMAYYPAKNSVS